MSETAENLNQLLHEIERELRQIDLWTETSPDPQALQSNQPFCHDTLPFAHWIQWVMIPTFDKMLSEGRQLPEQSELSPMAEIAFADINEKTDQLLRLIQQLDELINHRASVA